jgi:hypothetical protein
VLTRGVGLRPFEPTIPPIDEQLTIAPLCLRRHLSKFRLHAIPDTAKIDVDDVIELIVAPYLAADTVIAVDAAAFGAPTASVQVAPAARHPRQPVAERAACTIPTQWTFAPSTAALRTDAAVRDRAENPWG